MLPRVATSPPCCALCYLELLPHCLVLLPRPIASFPCCATCCFKLCHCLKLLHCFIASLLHVASTSFGLLLLCCLLFLFVVFSSRCLLMPCCFELPHTTLLLLLCCFIAFCCFCYFYFLLPLVTSLLQATSHCFATFLPHITFYLVAIAFQVLFDLLHLLLHHLVASRLAALLFWALLPCCLTPCCLVALLLCVGWYFLPPYFFVGRNLELGEANSPATKKG